MGPPPESDHQPLQGYEPLYRVASSYLGALWVVRDTNAQPAELGLSRHLQLPESVGEEARQTLLHAALEARRLHHDNVLDVLEVLAEGRRIGVISPHVEAEPLRVLQSWSNLRCVPFPTEVVLRVVSDLLAGLQTVHEEAPELSVTTAFGGLSPDSVLIARDGRTRITDAFVAGCAGLLPAYGRNTSKLAYAAPEQLQPTAQLNEQCDVFACGALLWEMLTGRRLLTGSAATIQRKLLEHDLPNLEDQLRGHRKISAALLELVDRALSIHPSNRPASAAAFRRSLVDCGHEVAEMDAVANYVGQLSGRRFERRNAAVRSKSGATRLDVSHPPTTPRLPGLANAAPERSRPRPRGRSRIRGNEPSYAAALTLPFGDEPQRRPPGKPPSSAEPPPLTPTLRLASALEAPRAQAPDAPAHRSPPVPREPSLERQPPDRGAPAGWLPDPEPSAGETPAAAEPPPATERVNPSRKARASAADAVGPTPPRAEARPAPAHHPVIATGPPGEATPSLSAPARQRTERWSHRPRLAIALAGLLSCLLLVLAIRRVTKATRAAETQTQSTAQSTPNTETQRAPTPAGPAPAQQTHEHPTAAPAPEPASTPAPTPTPAAAGHDSEFDEQRTAGATPTPTPLRSLDHSRLNDAELMQLFALEKRAALPPCPKKRSFEADPAVDRARAALLSGDDRRAYEELCPATEAETAHAAALKRLAELALRHGDPTLALAAARRALKRDPDDPARRERVGDALAQAGELYEARRAWLGARPEAVTAARRRRLAKGYGKLGRRALTAGSPGRALWFHRRSVTLTEGDYSASLGLSRALLADDQAHAAAAWAGRAARAFPRDSRVQLLYGDALHAEGKTREAVTAWKQALSSRPGFAAAARRVAKNEP